MAEAASASPSTILNAVRADDLARVAKRRAKQEILRQFDELRFRAAKILEDAYSVAVCGDLDDVLAKQMLAAQGLAGGQFYCLTTPARAPEFVRLRANLDLICRKVDPLIEAVGAQAKLHSAEINDADFKDCFRAVTEKALVGNATYLLDRCAEEAGRPMDADTRAETKREFERS